MNECKLLVISKVLNVMQETKSNDKMSKTTKVKYEKEKKITILQKYNNFYFVKKIVRIDTKRKHVYVIAALVKSLADVPEQIWHALENHRYLHASRLYILAKQVHEYLEKEKTKSIIDIEVAFPVIQRQWDAVCVFGPQIIQRSMHYLRISEQSSEVKG